MKTKCDRELFLKAFQTAAMVVPARTSHEILSNLKLEVSSSGVELIGTDLEVGIRLAVPGFEIETPGTVVLPVDRTIQILRECSDETLRLENDGQRTWVRGQWSEFQLPSEDPAQYPAVQGFLEGPHHEIGSKQMKLLVRRTAFATDTQDNRYALGGVLMEFDSDRITAIGTDGRRMAVQPAEATGVDGHGQNDSRPIVPVRALNLLQRALEDSDEPVKITARENDIIFSFGQTTIYSRLLEGRFPVWGDILAGLPGGVRLDLPVGPLASVVRQSMIVTDQKDRSVEFQFGDGQLVLTAIGAERGESRVEMPIDFDGGPLTVKLFPPFLLDFLKLFEPDQVFQLVMSDPKRPLVAQTDDGYRYVMMPLAKEARSQPAQG